MSRFKIQKDKLEIEPDAIVDTEEHDLYECRTWAMKELCDLLNQQDEKIKELEKENGYILFEDGYDEKGNVIHKQIYRKYKDDLDNLIFKNYELKQELANELDDHEKFTKKSDEEIKELKGE